MNPEDRILVSVVTPAYNQGIYLRDTIESVLSQDYPDIELYVINDGSSDDTEKILQDYSGRIKWETQVNMGQTSTINKGWRLTNGSVITWLNSDDTFLPGAVKRGVEYLRDHPETGIVFGDSMFTAADGSMLERTRPLPPFNYCQFVKNCRNPISQPSAFIRREVIQQIGELDPHFYYFMDWDFWLRAGLYFRIDYMPEIWSTYRLHADSKTVAQSVKAAPELEFMYRKYFSRNDIPLKIKKIRKKAMMNMFFTSGSYYLQGKDKRSASLMARKAIRQNPLGIFEPSALHKYFYCKWGGWGLYKKIKKLLGSKL